MNLTYILKHKDGYYCRVARQTIDIPGRVLMRDWVLVNVDSEFGSPTHDTWTITIPGASVICARVNVEKMLLDSGDYTIQKVIQL